VFFPEFLLKLSARDEQITWLDPLSDNVSALTATASLTVTFTLPDTRALILQAANVRGIAGVGQTCDRLQIVLSPRATAAGNALLLEYVAAALENSRSWSGSLLVPPQWVIQGNVRFNAGVAANDVRLSLFGMFIPVANIQRI
jgi:hypothetical protein